ncbi:MAG TPA: AmmeMemoRadiSam system protein A [Bacillota bacterium]|nr:AmmeMemoRadiSam system protein A [Bacillota bacterium]HPZ91068.1 AmmeMemoRadiSam system protein A [Bacillota bacterium]HQE01897.1 AmmeMemoRadiSam system protein A [Bacillota bacterium]
MSSVVFAGFVPHPPLLVEGIGDKEKAAVRETDAAYREFSRRLAAKNPDTVVVVTPHGPVFSDAYTMADWDPLRGDFTPFGATVAMSWPCNCAYVRRAEALARERDLPLVALSPRQLAAHRHSAVLDHGTMVPLWYLEQAGWRGRVVCVRIGGLPPAQCYAVGRVLAQAAQEPTAIVASGDLSHCLTENAPSPYNPAGAEFDGMIRNALARGDFQAVVSIPPDLRLRAAECGWRPLVTLLGALAGRSCTTEVLSYQGPFGVGYLVATLEPGPGNGAVVEFATKGLAAASPHVRLAREAIRHYLTSGRVLDPVAEPPLDRRAAAFVSLKLDDQLRGCIGTVEPTQPHLAGEIVANAIAAATRDPRFAPVTLAELDQLSISVDVLGAPAPARFSQLDPARLGLIARWRGRQGLLLPDLPGVDTPEEQLRIVCAKAGIPPDKAGEAELFTFTVERYH